MQLLPPPPWPARRLLLGLLPATDRDDVVANLDDLYQAYARRRGRWRAQAWDWRQALFVPLHLLIAGDGAAWSAAHPRTALMRTILQDLHDTWRQHRNRPGFALVAIASLAIAIG